METIFETFICWSRNYAFEGGIAGISIAILLLGGLVYLFLNRNQVMTITYGLTLLSMVIFLVLCILALLLTGIYGVSQGKSQSSIQDQTIWEHPAGGNSVENLKKRMGTQNE